MSFPRCALTRLIPDRPDVEGMKEEGWRDYGILVVDLREQKLTPIERKALNSIGNRLYGRRKETIDGRR